MALALGSLVALGMALAAEGWLRYIGKGERASEKFGCYLTNVELGAGYRPNCSTRWVGRLGGTAFYDTRFTSDAYGRRVTPQSAPQARSRLAVFTGCSFTLGVGVGDDETLPHYFGEAAPQYRVLNYAVSGFGPQQALLQVDHVMEPASLGPYEGTPLLVYTMIGDHLYRAVGARKVIAFYGHRFPSYALRADGSLVLEGSFLEAHPWRTFLAKLMDKSYLLRRIPERIDADDVELSAQILAATGRRFKERFGSDRFVVLAYPGARPPEFRATLARLRQLGVRVLDPNDVIAPGERRELRYPDYHPRPEANRRLGPRLAAELRALGWLDEAPATAPASR